MSWTWSWMTRRKWTASPRTGWIIDYYFHGGDNSLVVQIAGDRAVLLWWKTLLIYDFLSPQGPQSSVRVNLADGRLGQWASERFILLVFVFFTHCTFKKKICCLIQKSFHALDQRMFEAFSSSDLYFVTLCSKPIQHTQTNTHTQAPLHLPRFQRDPSRTLLWKVFQRMSGQQRLQASGVSFKWETTSKGNRQFKIAGVPTWEGAGLFPWKPS